jgi:hypothetical protein
LSDNKIYLPESIADNPLPVAGSILIPAESATQAVAKEDTVYTPGAEVERQFPEIVIARETISTSIDTQTKRILGSYEFGALGAIQVGTYVNGVSGDLRITPSGITGRNINGVTTFSIDATTGDATFMGTLAAGTILAGALNVGGASVVIDGANTRILVTDETGTPRVLLGYQLGGF